MKKVIALFMICFFSVQMNAQDKADTKKEAKKVAKVINNSLADMAKSIDKMDWNSLGDLIANTVVLVEKHTDAIVEIANNIDTKQLEENANKLATKIEKNIDVEKLEKELDKISKKIENASKQVEQK